MHFRFQLSNVITNAEQPTLVVASSCYGMAQFHRNIFFRNKTTGISLFIFAVSFKLCPHLKRYKHTYCMVSGILSTCWHFLFENTSPLKTMAIQFKFCLGCHFQNFEQAEEWSLSGNMEQWNIQVFYVIEFSFHPFQYSLFYVLPFSVRLQSNDTFRSISITWQDQMKSSWGAI
jgi:hypothetical protein